MAQQDPDKSADDAAAHLPTPLECDAANSAAQTPPSLDEAMFASIEDAEPIGADDPPASREPNEPSGPEREDRFEHDPIAKDRAADPPARDREPESFDLDAHDRALDPNERVDEASLHTPAPVATPPDLRARAIDADSAAQEPLDQDSQDLDAHEPHEREPDQTQPDATGVTEVAPVVAANLRAHESEPAAPEPPPAPRKRGFWRKFMLFLALLGLVATGGGYAAIQFKDKDERLKLIAEHIEGALADPQGFFLSLQEKAMNLLADAPSNSDRVALETPADPAPEPSGIASQAETPQPEAAPKSAPTEPVGKETAGEAAKEELGRLVKRIEQLEEATKEAVKAAREAKEAKPAAAQPSPEEGTYLNALEGRIDELADEIRVVRERLDTPKNETRLAPEPAETQKPAPGKTAGAAADIVVVAQSLLHELERGRPYAAEQAALSNLGADPELLAALAPSAESGAPTAAQLLKSFTTVSRPLRALEGPKTGSSLADQLMQEASRLVKVRPTHEPAAETIFDVVGKIETALAHDDVGAAADAFARLPDNAKAEAKAFGEALNRRRDAEKAAASLLSGAIAALGRAKN